MGQLLDNSKEKNPFYLDTKENMKHLNYKVENMKKISESEIILPITSEGSKFELSIKNYKNGIFHISFDLNDKSLKYKNKVDIGADLIPTNFDSILEEKDKIILISKDNSDESEINVYKLVINQSDFELEYYINDNLLFSLNKKKNLNLIYKIDPEDNKCLKSNTMDLIYYNMNEVYGIPERASQFFLKDGDYRLFNTDTCLDAKSTKQAYGAIPMLHGINKDYILTVFNNNSSDQYLEISSEKEKNEKNILWYMEGCIIDMYITSDTNYYRNHKKIADILGYSIMPPLWAMGYHQCRWGYKDENDAMEVEKKFNELNIPFDCFWFDIEHTDEKRYFTWDPKNFGNIKQLLDKLNKSIDILLQLLIPI